MVRRQEDQEGVFYGELGSEKKLEVGCGEKSDRGRADEGRYSTIKGNYVENLQEKREGH